jgi:F-type H+-transporting ATPase subunit b
MVKAIPTIFLFIVLYFYLKVMLFGPLEKVLSKRDELTAGARKAAEASRAAAERKQQEYERKFTEARAEVYRAQEETRNKWLNDQAEQVAEARKRSDKSIHDAKDVIEVEASTARQALAATSAQLADEIATAILSRKPERAR